MSKENTFLLKIKKYDYPMKGSTDRCKYTTNFCGYYLEQRKLKLIHFQDLFKLAEKFEEKKKNSLREYINSVWVRFEYVLFNKDQIKKIHDGCDIDNDSQFLIECFIYNFIILSYSLLDSLAWIIHHWYDLSLHRLQITLNFRDKDKLKKKIRQLNGDLAEFLEQDEIQNWVQTLQEYRDQIQHRQKVHVMPEEGPDYKRMVIERKPGLCGFYPNFKHDKFEEAYMPVWEKHGNLMQPVLEFCDEYFEQITEIIENVSLFLKNDSSYVPPRFN